MRNFKDYLRQILIETIEVADASFSPNEAENDQLKKLREIDPNFKPEEEEPVEGDDDYCEFMDVPCGQGGGTCRVLVGNTMMCWSGCATNNTGWKPCTVDPTAEPPGPCANPKSWTCLAWILGQKGLRGILKDQIPWWVPINPPTPPNCTPGEGQWDCNQAWNQYHQDMLDFLQRLVDWGYLPTGNPAHDFAICQLFPSLPFCND